MTATSDDADVAARIRDSFARQTMLSSIGAGITFVRPGHVGLAAPVGAGFRQQQGFAHGGLIFTLGDCAAGYAALSVMPPDVEVMTAELKINLLSPGQGRLAAEGRVLKAGRRLVVVAADVWAEDAEGAARRHVAALQGTMVAVRAD